MFPHLKRDRQILNTFEIFLAIYVEVFEEHDKIHLAMTKICSLLQKTHFASM